nr:MAG TPA: tail-collar fiber protein [Caudoviricetes sp.]
MANAVITNAAKIKLLRARSGDIPFATIAQMAFGTGGVSSSGDISEANESDTSLAHEVLRKNLDSHAFDGDKTMGYTATLRNHECIGEKITELALVDSDGDIVCIKRFSPKQKDADIEMSFDIYDTF